MKRIIRQALLAGVVSAPVMVLPIGSAAQAQTATRNYSIAAQDLGDALRQFANQSGRDVVFDPALVAGKTSKGVQGQYSAEAALRTILEGSGLSYTTTSAGFAIRGNGGDAVGNDSDGNESPARSAESHGAIAEILVVGARTQNADIRRTEDDPQPYVVYDRKEIERSQATNLEDFLRRRLPMNASNISNAQVTASPAAGNISSINLRGLGANQTLILVDGRRQPRVLASGLDFTQADINGIPISAIERIEILPSTAGGIYGGGAVGGVINIIRKRNYKGFDLRASSELPTRGGAENLRIDLSGGFSLEGGRTHVSMSASHSSSEPLYEHERSLFYKGRLLLAENDPTFINNPPLGYTTNVRSVSGEPLVLDDGREIGAAFGHVPVGYLGVSSDAGAALIDTGGVYNLELADNASFSGGRRGLLLPGTRARSANLNLRRTFGTAVDGFIDLTFNDNLSRSRQTPMLIATLTADSPGNPFRQPVRVNVPVIGLDAPVRNKSQVVAATTGIVAKLSSDWTSNIEYAWSRSRSEYSFSAQFMDTAAISSAISLGQIDVFRDTNLQPLDLSGYAYETPNIFSGPFDAKQETFTARVSGKLFSLPGGPVSLTALLEHRREKAEASYVRSLTATLVTPSRSQVVDSGYLEFRAPIFTSDNEIPLIHELEAQASIRHDRYHTRVASESSVALTPDEDIEPYEWDYSRSRLQSTDVTFGVRWVPLEDLSLRASYGSGFLPPSISQLTPITTVISTGTTTDPLRGDRVIGSEVPYTLIWGGNPDLTPELSKSYAIGVILKPRVIPGLRLSADYTVIRKSDEIVTVTEGALVQNPNDYPGRVKRGPNIAGDPPGWPGPVTFLDTSKLNLAKSVIKAVDVQADLKIDTRRLGAFHAYALATRVLARRQKASPSSPTLDTVGFTGGPLKWRGNAGIDWRYGPLEVAWNAQYYHSYSIRAYNSTEAFNDLAVLRQGTDRIPTQVYHDLSASYQFSGSAYGSSGLLSDSEVRIGVHNVFDQEPPIINTASQSIGYSSYGDPRRRRIVFSIRKSF